MTVSALVTVIVPGYNTSAYAQEAIDSLKAQSLDAWQAVLVDDASDDDTAAIFEAAESDERFHVVRHSERRGLGAARNSGLDLLDTPFVAFLDSDDVMRPYALERMTGTLLESGSDLAVGAYVRLRPNADGSYSAGDVQPWVEASTAPERRATTLDEHPEVTGNIVAWSKVSHRDMWQELRFPEGKLYEDQIVAQQLYSRARAIDTIPEVIVEWRVRADGSSITQREADITVLRDCLEAMRGGLDVLDTRSPRAADARRRLISSMDIPRLTAIAQEHPDPEYRALLDRFTQTLSR